MATIRVHELDLPSRQILAELCRMGEDVRSAASALEVSVAAQVRQTFAYTNDGRPRLMRAPRPRGPVPAPPPRQITAVEAWTVVGVRPATVRQWVSRGYLRSAGTRGRTALYRRDDLLRVRESTRARTNTVPVGVVLELPEKYDERLITVTEAAQLLGVAPSTVRSWITRGRLTSAGRSGRAHLVTVRAVGDAARRGRPRF